MFAWASAPYQSALEQAVQRREKMVTPSEILVVDDDVPSLAGLLSLLRNLGYRSTGAAEVEGALALLDAFPFDVLIADVHLLGESGFKMIRRAREVQPAITVIAITDFPDPAVEEEVTKLDAIFMRKPLDVGTAPGHPFGESDKRPQAAAMEPQARRRRIWCAVRGRGGENRRRQLRRISSGDVIAARSLEVFQHQHGPAAVRLHRQRRPRVGEPS